MIPSSLPLGSETPSCLHPVIDSELSVLTLVVRVRTLIIFLSDPAVSLISFSKSLLTVRFVGQQFEGVDGVNITTIPNHGHVT
jgi:hypothetical protein